MTETFDIAGYARISVDDEQEQKNISIENQKAIIEDYVKTHFPGSTLTFFEDRDRSGYTFEQREGYQEMRRGLMQHKYDILIIKDFSRFSRRNSRGLVELEDLRDAGGAQQVMLSDANGKFAVSVAAPILSGGDVLGLVVFLSAQRQVPGETEYKLAQTVAAFLGKHMEG